MSNKEKLAIVVVGYNRLKGLQRLLASLKKADYRGADVPLVISIDCSGCQDVYDFAQEVEWPFGEKLVNIQEKRLGLKAHIFKCFELTKQFKAVILLEDDIVVSPCFYSYTQKALDVYANDESVVGISLYKYEMNPYAMLPFVPYDNGSDTFLLRHVSTWGECMSERMWDGFKAWMDAHEGTIESDIEKADMPQNIKNYKRAWSKYFYTYMCQRNGYFVYPYHSVTTNYSEAGEHDRGTNSVQVSMQMSQYRDYVMLSADECVKYDSFENNERLYQILGLPKEELTLDCYGFPPRQCGTRYLLTTRSLPYKVLRSYALSCRPIELNVINEVEGNGLYLYDTSGKGVAPKNGQLFEYWHHGLRPANMVKEVWKIIKSKIINPSK